MTCYPEFVNTSDAMRPQGRNAPYGPGWDPSALFGPTIRSRLEREEAACLRVCESFAGTALSMETFPGLIRDYEAILSGLDRAEAFDELRRAIRTRDAQAEAWRQRVLAFRSRVRNRILGFELAWAGLDEPSARAFLSALGSHPARHNLAKARLFGPHRLSPDREALLEEALTTVRSGWTAQWGDLAGEAGAGVLLARQSLPGRARRATAAGRLAGNLRGRRALFARVLEELVLAQRMEGRARNHPHWLFARCVEEETTPRAVERLVGRAARAFPLVARYCRLKARLLGLDVLAAHDRLAPLPGLGRAMSWQGMRGLVLAALGRISPNLAQRAVVLFEEGRIDASPKPGKAPGAFCRAVGTGEAPYVLLNATGKARDAAVLAHELGHGLHHLLSDCLGPLGARPPAALAEALAVCCELALHEERLSRARSDKARLAALCQRLEDDITTIFRQAALHLFEDGLHRRATLTADDLDSLWTGAQDELYQDAVRDHDPSGWAVTPHFFLVPGYVHVYARAGCLAWGIWSRRESMGAGFGPAFEELCAAGGSRPLAELLAPFNLAPDDPGLADLALERFANHLKQAERLAGQP